MSVFHAFVNRLLFRTSTGRSDPLLTRRTLFEARYEDELFMAKQLMLRGGAAAPEDQIWVNKLMAAYQATSDVAYDTAENIGDPWAVDTQAGVFQTAPTEHTSNRRTDVPTDTFSSSNEEAPVAEARKFAP